MIEPERVHVPKLAGMIAARLREHMITGELAAGDRLPPETELMRRYGASRPSVREALRILESEDLIRVMRGTRGGAIAIRPRPDAFADQLMTSAALWNSDAGELDALVEAVEVTALRRLGPLLASGIGTLRATEPDFHAAMISAAGADLTVALYCALSRTLDTQCTNASAHARVLRAVAAGDQETAVAAWRRHRTLTATGRQERGA